MGADREWIVGSLGSKNGLMALEGTSTNTHKSSLTRGDYLGRRALDYAAFVEVRIFCDDDQVVPAGVVPDLRVRCATEPVRLNMDGAGIDIGQCINQPRRQVLIEEQSHALDAS